MDENKICKCCCSESGRFCPSDVRWRKVVRLINPFVFWSELLMRKTQLLKNPQSPLATELTQNRVDWKTGRPVEVGRTASQPQCHMQGPTKCLPNPSFTAPTAGCISLLLNPLGYVEQLWDLCFAGTRRAEIHLFPSQKKHFQSHYVVVSDSSL